MPIVNGISKRAAGLANSWWSIVVIAALIGGLVYQKWSTASAADFVPDPLHTGEQLPSALQVRSLDDGPAAIEWSASNRPTLLYIFKLDCVWCARNMECLRTVVGHASNYRVIGLSLTDKDLREYVQRNQLGFPVYVTSGRSNIKLLKAHGTPETIVVSTEGKVTNVWVGAYGGKKKLEIQKVFGVVLPDIPRLRGGAQHTTQ